LAQVEGASIAELDSLDTGPARVVEVVGEPRSGKTRLLAELAAAAEARGHAVFAGRATELEPNAPFAPLVEALDEHVASLSRESLGQLDRQERTQLAAVFPALAGLRVERVTGLPEERYRPQHAMGSLLEVVARARPAVLLLDDLQWADPATGELLTHLMRRRPDAPLLLVLASQPAEAPPSFVERLVARGKQPAERRILLPAPEEPAPDVELDTLGPAARALLQGAAMAGDPFDLDLAGLAADLPAEEAAAALDELRERGLVGGLRFRHPRIRKAAYDAPDEKWRRAAHGRVAAALAASGAAGASRAHHVQRSAEAGDFSAVALLEQTGHASAPLAPATAAWWFESALRLVPESNRDRRLGLLLSLAGALGPAGALEDSRVALGEAYHLLPPEMTSLREEALADMAAIDRLQGRGADAHALLADALERLPDPDSREAAALGVALAADRWESGDSEAAREWAERALCCRLEEPGLRAAATAILALAAFGTGDVPAVRERLEEACDLVDDLPDPDLGARLDACTWLGWCELGMERYEDAIGHLRRGLIVARATGQGRTLLPMTLALLSAEALLGRLPVAARHAEEAYELARLSGAAPLLGRALAARCRVAMRQGRLDYAIACGEHAVAALPEGAPDAVCLGEAQVEAGSFDCGREQLLQAAGGPGLPAVEPALRPALYEVLVRAELGLGRVEDAQAWAERAAAGAEGLGLGAPTGWALRAAAEVALARGDARPAADLALEAAASHTAQRIEAARGRIVAGRALGAAGEEKRAAAELQCAVTELEACGASGYREEAAEALRRPGAPEPRP
jgi:tetratricopeptide (TPR) repeat protein